MNNNYKLIFGDCLEEMESIEDRSINLIAADLPYGVTNNRWDSVIDLEEIWKAFERISADNGIVVLTATQPFVTTLIVSNKEYCKKLKFKYDLIWEKTISSGQLNVRYQPMRNHEHVLIFAKPKPAYNEQKTKGAPYKITRKLKKYNERSFICTHEKCEHIFPLKQKYRILLPLDPMVDLTKETPPCEVCWSETKSVGGERCSANYGTQKDEIRKENDGYRHAKSVIRISNPRTRGGHPTQKPEALMTHIIKAYSDEGATVLDCCMGSGTTGVSAIKENRRFIGIENDEKYFKVAEERIKKLIEEEK